MPAFAWREGAPMTYVADIRRPPIQGAPGLAVLVLPLVLMGLDDLATLKIVTVISTWLTLLVAYKLIQWYFDERYWIWILALIAFNPMTFYLSHHLTTYAPFTLFSLLGIYFFERYQRRTHWSNVVLGVASVWAATMINHVGVCLMAGIFFWLLFHRHWRWAIGVATIWAALLVPWLIYLLVTSQGRSVQEYQYGLPFYEYLVLDQGPFWLALSFVLRVIRMAGSYVFRNIPWLLLGWYFSDVSLFAGFHPTYLLKAALGLPVVLTIIWGLLLELRDTLKCRQKPSLYLLYSVFWAGMLFSISRSVAHYASVLLIFLLVWLVRGASSVLDRSTNKARWVQGVLAVLLILGIGNCMLELAWTHLEERAYEGQQVEVSPLLDTLIGRLPPPASYDWLHWLKANTQPDDVFLSSGFTRHVYLYLGSYGLEAGNPETREDLTSLVEKYPQVNYVIVQRVFEEDKATGQKLLYEMTTQHPERYHLVFESPSSSINVYRDVTR
jgi:hypothetical protein